MAMPVIGLAIKVAVLSFLPESPRWLLGDPPPLPHALKQLTGVVSGRMLRVLTRSFLSTFSFADQYCS